VTWDKGTGGYRMGMVSRMGFGERAGICRHGKTMLARRSRRMLDFLDKYVISSDLKIYIPPGMQASTTFEEAIFGTDWIV
jgi:hypothetical protein